MNSPPTREIPLRNIFLTVGDYLRAGLRYWWVLVLFGVGLGVYRAYVARETKTKYYAALTFVLNENQTNRGVGGILGQFGLGGGQGGGATPDKIIALAKSQKLINELLLDTITVEGRDDRLANHLIGVYDLVEEWSLREERRRIVNGQISTMTEPEKALLKRMYSFVTGEAYGVLSVKVNDDTGILTLTVVTRSQPVSLAICYGLYDKLSRFYTEESTGNSRATVERLRLKSDSVAAALNAAEYRLARAVDTRLGALQRRDLVRQYQLEREVQILNVTYAEVLRNLETATFALSTKTPFFQTIDEPFTPLYNEEPNWKEELIYGGLLGAFAGFVLVSIVKFYRDVMADQQTPQWK